MCKPKLGLDGVDTPYLDFRMPTRALMLLQMLKLGPKVKTGSASRLRRRVCGYAEFKAAAKKLGLDHSDEVVEHLLRILSGLGAVSWFPEATRDLVVLDPQWLLDSLSCLIREHKGHHSQLLEHLEHDTKAMPHLRKGDVTNGIFAVKLLEYIWSSDKAEYGALKGQPMEVKALKRILEHFGLIARVRLCRDNGDTESDECYVVPALLPDSISPDSYLRDFLQRSNANKCRLICDFSKNKWLQHSVFQRLVCTMVARLRSVMPVTHLSLTQHVACMYAGDAVLTLRLDAKHWQIEAQTVNYKQCPHASRWMLDLVLDNMKRVLQVFPKEVPYRVFLSAGNDLLVKLSDLKQGGAMVCAESAATHATASRAPKFVDAKPLRSTWLRDSTDCEFCCCSKSPPDVCGHV